MRKKVNQDKPPGFDDEIQIMNEIRAKIEKLGLTPEQTKGLFDLILSTRAEIFATRQVMHIRFARVFFIQAVILVIFVVVSIIDLIQVWL